MEEWHSLCQQLMDDLDYVEFSETRLLPSFSTEVCIVSFSLSFIFSHIFLHMVILNCDDYVKVRLVLLVVVLLPLLVYIGRSMLMALMTLLGSILWDVTRMSWVIPFRRVHKWGALFHPCLVFSFLPSLKTCFNTVFFSNLTH